jgi:hypothetical protein
MVGRKLNEKEGVLRESSGFDRRTVEEGLRSKGGQRMPEKAERLPRIK